MSSDLKIGSAWWMVWDATLKQRTLIYASYSSATAWLSHTNSGNSSVAYTTDWITRFTSTAQPLTQLKAETFGIRPLYGSATAYFYDELLLATTVYAGSGAYTPTSWFLFVEGNLTGVSPIMYADFVTRR